jgi:hypothetical protein
MAATHPTGDPEVRTRRSPWLAVAVAVAVIAVIGVIAYVLLYNGGSGGLYNGGSGGAGGGSGDTGGYVVVAFAGDTVRRAVARFRR